MHENTGNRSNPKDRNFDQEEVTGESKSTAGEKQKEEKEQDDYNAQDRNFDHSEVSGKPDATSERKPEEDDKADEAEANRNIDPSLRQGAEEGPHE